MSTQPNWAEKDQSATPAWAESAAISAIPGWAETSPVWAEPPAPGLLDIFREGASVAANALTPTPTQGGITATIFQPLKTVRDFATTGYQKAFTPDPALVEEKKRFQEGIGQTVSGLTEKAAMAGLPDWAVKGIGTAAAIPATGLQIVTDLVPTSSGEAVVLGATAAMGAGAGRYAAGLPMESQLLMAKGARISRAAQVSRADTELLGNAVPSGLPIPPPTDAPTATWLYKYKQKLARSINAQKQDLENFAAQNAGNNTRGVQSEYKAKLDGLHKDQQALADTVTELGQFRASANAAIERDFGPGVADAATSRLTSMSIDDITRNMTELVAAQKAGLVKPVTDTPTVKTATALLERGARPIIDSEKQILSLNENTAAMRAVANQAIVDLRNGKGITKEAGEQLMVAISDSIHAGELTPTTAAQMINIPSLVLPESRAAMARWFLQSASQHGKGLAELSRVCREVERVLGKEPAVKAVFDEARKAGVIEPWSLWTSMINGYRYADNIRRASMVSGISTTVRNVISQGERSLSNAFEDAVSGAFGMARGRTTLSQTIDLVHADAMGFVHALSKNGRLEIGKVLERFPLETERLFGSPVGDVTLGSRASRILNTFNTAQEFFFRRAAFDAHIRQTMALFNKPMEALTAEEVSGAVHHALDMTYAASPKSAMGRDMLQLYQSAPFLTAISNPFPRFWMNALKRLGGMSGSPFIFQSGETFAKMSSADPRVAGAALGKAMTGALYTSAGYAMAEMGLWGEKWYEVKVGEKRYDVRPFSPILAPLFVGRMVHDIQKEGKDALLRLTPDDWIQATLSLKRTDATGIPLIDIAFSKTENEFSKNILKTFAGYATSFVPRLLSTTPRDVVGIWSKEERLPRYTKGDANSGLPLVDKLPGPIVNAGVAMFPFWDRRLPVSPAPLRDAPEERIDIGRRLLGLVGRIKTPAEVEADHLGVQPRNIYPYTGNADYDRLIVERMGPIAQKGLTRLMAAPPYMQQNRKLKKAMFESFINKFKDLAHDATQKTDPKFRVYDFVRDQDKITKELLKQVMDEQGIEYEL